MEQKLRDLRPEWASKLSRDEIEALLTLHAWGVLSIDGLYFLEIERRYGTQVATDIDTEVWKVYGRLEAERIKAALHIEGHGLEDVAQALRISSWLFYVPDYVFDNPDEEGTMALTVRDCRIQRKRMEKGLVEFPCKPVGVAYLEEFVKVFNERVRVSCQHCPPDEHPEDSWCKWRFELEG